MGEVRAAAGAQLDHPTTQASEQLPAVLICTATLSNVRDLRIDAREYRMRGVLSHQSTVPLASPVSSRAGAAGHLPSGRSCGGPSARSAWCAFPATSSVPRRYLPLPPSPTGTTKPQAPTPALPLIVS